MVVRKENLRLLPMVGKFAVGQVVGGEIFFLEQVTAVFLIAEDAEHHG